jgi:hypothetical protein
MNIQSNMRIQLDNYKEKKQSDDEVNAEKAKCCHLA